VFGTWEEQVEYLRNEKIAKYLEHYYNRFENGQLVESWMLPGDIVFEILVRKLKKKFPTVLEKKDPRLSASISNGEIKKYGKRVL
jgi:Ni,Fe-hydrogenase III component G